MTTPLFYWMNGQFYSWEHGLPVSGSKTRTLVRCFPQNCNFWTWIDDLGERAWEIAR